MPFCLISRKAITRSPLPLARTNAQLDLFANLNKERAARYWSVSSAFHAFLPTLRFPLFIVNVKSGHMEPHRGMIDFIAGLGNARTGIREKATSRFLLLLAKNGIFLAFSVNDDI